MKSIRMSLLVWLALAAVAGAQMGPPPVAAEMQKFEPMLGHWEGSGTARMAAGAEAMPWSSKGTCKKILGGHFVLEDMTITMGPDMPPMLFRNVYTWDRRTERYLVFQGSNLGGWKLAPMHWTDDGKVIDASVAYEEGRVVTDRWVSTIGDGEMRFTGWRSVQGGEPFVHVEGKLVRGGEGFTVTAASAEHALAPAAKELNALSVMIGEWDFGGEMVVAPGVPKMKVSGRESICRILGGHLMCFEIVGEKTPEFPHQYEGFGFMGWDPAEKCLMNIGFDNLGEFHTQSVYPQEGRRALMYMKGVQMGSPLVAASVMEWAEDGSTITFWTDCLTQGHPAQRTFEGKSTRRKTQDQADEEEDDEEDDEASDEEDGSSPSRR